MPLLKQGRIYESLGTHNCVFTGIDDNNNIKYIMQRAASPGSSLKFESQGSDKAYSFSLKGINDTVYVFESPIDLLSYRNIHTHVLIQGSHMLSLGGLTDVALKSYTERTPGIHNIIFCLDSDIAAKDAYSTLSRKYALKGFKIDCHFPEQKDWNMQLLSLNRCDSLTEPHI